MNLFISTLFPVLTDPLVVDPFFINILGWTKIPEIGPVQSDPESAVLFPDQGTHHAIAQGHSLIPGAGQLVAYQVMWGWL